MILTISPSLSSRGICSITRHFATPNLFNNVFPLCVSRWSATETLTRRCFVWRVCLRCPTMSTELSTTSIDSSRNNTHPRVHTHMAFLTLQVKCPKTEYYLSVFEPKNGCIFTAAHKTPPQHLGIFLFNIRHDEESQLENIHTHKSWRQSKWQMLLNC